MGNVKPPGEQQKNKQKEKRVWALSVGKFTTKLFVFIKGIERCPKVCLVITCGCERLGAG